MSLFLKHPGHVEWTTEQIKQISEIARKFGNGKVYTTMREGIYLPEVIMEEQQTSQNVQALLEKVGIVAGQATEKACQSHSLLNFNVCIGRPVCPKGLANVKELAEILKSVFLEYQENNSLPGDVRVALSGCPNRCARPQINDIGIHGCEQVYTDSRYCIGCLNCVETCYCVALKRNEQGIIERDYNRCSSCGYCRKVCPSGATQTGQYFYEFSFGGRLGRLPKPPEFTLEVGSRKKALAVFQKALEIYSQKAERGQRFSNWLEQFGAEKLQAILAEIQDD